MKLPEKKYYSLPEVAERLGCTTSDVLHYGAIDKLKIAAYIPDDFLSKMSSKLSNDNYYYLDTKDIEKIQYEEECITLSRFNPVNGHRLPFSINTVTVSSFDQEFCEEGLHSVFIHKNKLVVFYNDLSAFVNDLTVPKSSSKDNAKIVTTLHKMVIAMAIDCYGYNPEDKKSTVTGDIQKALDTCKLTLSENTIRQRLKEGAELLPRE